MKLGIDFHGVIDRYPEVFVPIMNSLVKAGHEVHIITGARRSTFDHQLAQFMEYRDIKDLQFTHFFSISDFVHQQHPDKIDVSDPDHPVVHETELWDRIKGDYAAIMQLDMLIDDTPQYIKFCKVPFMLCINEKNNSTIDETKYVSTYAHRAQQS